MNPSLLETSLLEATVGRVLRAVRSFGKIDGETVHKDVERLKRHLSVREPFNMVENVFELQAVSLVFDYEDSRGEPVGEDAYRVGEYIRKNIGMLAKHIDADPIKQWRRARQLTWVLMAFALWQHRHGDLPKMGSTLDTVEEFIAKHLRKAKRPFRGTLCRYNYYRGLQYRDQGDLDAATDFFQESFAWAQDRNRAITEEVSVGSDGSLSVEKIFGSSCLGRVQAFGFGEIAFLRGDLATSQAWFISALSSLQLDELERWRVMVNVYQQGSIVLISPFTKDGFAQIERARKELAGLARRLEAQHRAYAELATAFNALGELRLEQITAISKSPDEPALAVTLRADLLDEVAELCPSRHPQSSTRTHIRHRYGAVSSLISLACSEVLLRGGRLDEAEAETSWVRKQFPLSIFVQVEADLLEAQILAAKEAWTEVSGLLEERSHDLHSRANRNQRAFWFGLTSIAYQRAHEGRSLSASIFAHRAHSVNERVRHGYVNHFVRTIVKHVTLQSPAIFPMPYQESSPNFSLRQNLDAAIDNTLKALAAFYPSINSRAELMRMLDYGKSTLYSKRHQQHINHWLSDLNERVGARQEEIEAESLE